MSKGLYHSVAAEVAQIMLDFREEGEEFVRGLYNIEIREDGSVFDFVYEREFGDLVEWVHYNNEQEQDDFDNKTLFGKYDDEDY